MKNTTVLILALSLRLIAASASAQSVMMSDSWAQGMCEAWNGVPGLTEELDKWMSNDKDRGYKLMRIYRRDCPDSPRIEMKISRTEAGVVCIDSGWATEEELTGADYVMYADTERWQEMGAGEYGPMKGMMTGRLKFEGPKFEAMRNMGPFTNFLLLVGKVPGAVDGCPEVAPDEPATEIEEEAIAAEEAPVQGEGEGSDDGR